MTEAVIEPDLQRRLESIAGWRERPDFASANFEARVPPDDRDQESERSP